MHVCWGVLLYLFSPYTFNDVDSHRTWSQVHSRQATIFLSPLSPIPPPELGLQAPTWPYLTFYTEAVDLNPGPHVCASALSH